MENHHGNHFLAVINLFISIFSGVYAWINISNIQSIAGLVASIIAIISGIFAARYYYYAAKEKKQNIYRK